MGWLHQPPLEMGNLSQREYLTSRLPEEWKAGTLLKEDLIKIAKKRMMLTQKVSQDVQKGEEKKNTEVLKPKPVARGTDDIIKMDYCDRSQR